MLCRRGKIRQSAHYPSPLEHGTKNQQICCRFLVVVDYETARKWQNLARVIGQGAAPDFCLKWRQLATDPKVWHKTMSTLHLVPANI